MHDLIYGQHRVLDSCVIFYKSTLSPRISCLRRYVRTNSLWLCMLINKLPMLYKCFALLLKLIAFVYI